MRKRKKDSVHVKERKRKEGRKRKERKKANHVLSSQEFCRYIQPINCKFRVSSREDPATEERNPLFKSLATKYNAVYLLLGSRESPDQSKGS